MCLVLFVCLFVSSNHLAPTKLTAIQSDLKASCKMILKLCK